MSVPINKALALTAATGLLAGLAACGGETKIAKDASDAAGDAAGDAVAEGKKAAVNCCKGKNACKGQGWIVTSKAECEEAGGTFEASS